MEKLEFSVSTNGGVPIACDMNAIAPVDQPAHAGALEALMDACLGFAEESEAVTFRYPAEPELLATAGRWMGLERQCCAFFDFDLSLAAGAEEFTVRVGGAPGVKEFLLANMGPEGARE